MASNMTKFLQFYFQREQYYPRQNTCKSPLFTLKMFCEFQVLMNLVNLIRLSLHQQQRQK